ncbi:MAG: hypothetical protein JNN16_17405 [Nitrospira sp.]|nr:hypothetical protein [Nitrospira sp.]MBS0167769.1 hypothetical protein [Nitrospira sp.]
MSLSRAAFLARYESSLVTTRFELPFMLFPRIKIAIILSHCCFALCLAPFTYSAKNYLLLHKILLPGMVALSPASGEKTDIFIAELLPNTEDGTAAKKMFSHRTEEMHRLHEAWLFHTKLHETFALYQTISWAVAAMISLGAVLILYRMKRQTH